MYESTKRWVKHCLRKLMVQCDIETWDIEIALGELGTKWMCDRCTEQKFPCMCVTDLGEEPRACLYLTIIPDWKRIGDKQ